MGVVVSVVIMAIFAYNYGAHELGNSSLSNAVVSSKHCFKSKFNLAQSICFINIPTRFSNHGNML